jgi:tetratricopeptide (TPR) repeat protein
MRARLGQASLPALSARSVLALCLAETGDLVTALPLAREAYELAVAAAQPVTLWFACSRLGIACIRAGQFAEAIGPLERGLATVEESGLPFHFSLVAAPLGAAYAATGRATQAVLLLERAVEQSASIGLTVGQPDRLGWLAEAYLTADRDEDARRSGDSALAVARAQGARGSEAWTHRVLGDVLSRVDAASSETHYHASADLARSLGMRPLVAQCHFGLGTLCARMGRSAEAREHLGTAAMLCRELDMPFWLEKAEEALRRVAVPP